MKLEFDSVSFGYGHKEFVIRDFSCTVSSGETVALLGRNGAGKTTLFRLMLGILSPKTGKISIDGKDMRLIGERTRARMISYIPQIAEASFPYTVMEAVLMGTAPSLGIFSHPGKDERKKALEALRLFGLENLKDRSIQHLSGGERQMTMIARALAQEALFIILDEPTSSLDYGNQILVLEILEKLRKKGIGLMFSTHNPEMAMRYATRILILDDGGLKYDGGPDELAETDILQELYRRKLFVKKIRTGTGWGYVCIPE